MRAIGIILAGGNNNRMRELSNKRAIAAMPIAGSYRAIDFALSNMAIISFLIMRSPLVCYDYSIIAYFTVLVNIFYNYFSCILLFLSLLYIINW